MLLVLCVDLDDDLGRKTGIPTPVIGADDVTEAAVALATADPEDSDVNVLFQGVNVHDELAAGGEAVEVAAVTGVDGSDVKANRAVGQEVDRVLAELSTGEEVSAVVITDGAQDESVLPDPLANADRRDASGGRAAGAGPRIALLHDQAGARRPGDPWHDFGAARRALLLIYPLVVVANLFDIAGAAVLGILSGVVGLYSLFRGLGLEETIDGAAASVRNVLYTGRVTLVTYVVALALIVVGGVQGMDTIETVRSVRGGASPSASRSRRSSTASSSGSRSPGSPPASVR